MKIAAYEVRPDEEPVIKGLCEKLGIDVDITGLNLDESTVSMAEGADGVTTGTIYLYEQVNGDYQQLGTYTVTFKE